LDLIVCTDPTHSHSRLEDVFYEQTLTQNKCAWNIISVGWTFFKFLLFWWIRKIVSEEYSCITSNSSNFIYLQTFQTKFLSFSITSSKLQIFSNLLSLKGIFRSKMLMKKFQYNENFLLPNQLPHISARCELNVRVFIIHSNSVCLIWRQVRFTWTQVLDCKGESNICFFMFYYLLSYAMYYVLDFLPVGMISNFQEKLSRRHQNFLRRKCLNPTANQIWNIANFKS
jgi:hypothetical protein